jgi:predicted phage-related endonuclease
MTRFIVVDHEQRSLEWYASRAGRLTGSVASDMLAKPKSGSGESAGRKNLRAKLVLERVTGKTQEDDYLSRDMQRGVDLESEAFGEFEALTGVILQRCGFLSMGDDFGCSLDGYLGDFEELVSIKCPNDANHMAYVMGGKKIPKDYMDQCRHELWITGARRHHFLSYNPNFPEKLRVFYVTMERAQFDLAEYEAEAVKFMAEVREETDKLLRLAA